MSGRDKKKKGNGEGQQLTNEDDPLPDYKDQVHGRSLLAEGRDITGQHSMYNLAFGQDVQEFENYHQSRQSPVASGLPQPVYDAAIFPGENNYLPNFKDQCGDVVRPSFSPLTPSLRDRAGESPAASAPVQNQRLPQFKDQVRDVVKGEEEEDQVPGYNDQARGVHRHLWHLAEHVHQGTDTTAPPPPNNYLPDYKDQTREIHPHLPNVAEYPSRRADASPHKSPDNYIPNFKDQVQRVHHPHSPTEERFASRRVDAPGDYLPDLIKGRIYRDLVPAYLTSQGLYRRDVSNYEDQMRREVQPHLFYSSRRDNASPRTSSPDHYVPNFKHQVQSVHHPLSPPAERYASRSVDAAPRVSPPGDYLPDFKDQARDVQSDTKPPFLPPDNYMPDYKDQTREFQPRLPNVAEYASRSADAPPRTSSPDNYVPNFKDQVQNVHRPRSLHQEQSVHRHEDDPLASPTYKNQVNPSPQELNNNSQFRYIKTKEPPRSTREHDQFDAQDTQSITASGSDEALVEDPAALFGPSMVQDYRHHASHDRVVEAQAVLVGEIFDESSTVVHGSEQVQELEKKARKKKVQLISFMIVAALIVLVAGAVGGVCGAGKCSGARGVVTETVMTMAPTVSCEDGDYPKAFETTAELYKAVDEYIDLFSSSETQQETDRDSIPCNVTFRHGPITQWDVSRLTDFQLVFHRNRDLYPNQDLLKPMTETIVLSEDIGAWNVSAATTMEGMFAGVEDFNPSFLQTWDTSRVTSMKSMFHSCSKQNADFSLWNTAAVTDFSFMFVGNSAFNGTGLRNWTTSSAENLSGMFSGDSSLIEVDFSGWNVNQVVDASYVFNGCSSFVGDVSAWSFNAVKSLRSMFQDCSSFNGDLSLWSVSGVTDFSSMFQGASIFNGNLSLWDTSNAELMNSTFQDAAAFTGVGLSLWNVSSVRYMNSMFEQASSLSSVDLSTWQTRNVESMASMFKDAGAFIGSGLSSWDVSSVRDMSSMFEGAASVGSIDLSGWRTDRLERTTSMFKSATSFNSDLPWKMSLVTDMFEMFYNASAFTGEVSFWDTSSCTNMGYLFAEANLFDGNLSYWDTSSVVTMESMFKSASPFNGDVSTWNTSGVTAMDSMFNLCLLFNGDISRWDVRNVQSASDMFRGAYSFNIDLSSWELRSIAIMDRMFRGASVFNQDLCAWGDSVGKDRPDTSSILKVQDIFQSTACPNMADPDSTDLSIGPWCHNCS